MKKNQKKIINYFLDYTGKVDIKHNHYTFFFNNHEISSNDYVLVCKPTLDNTFKKIFSKEPRILKTFLNDILFPKNQRIKNVEYIKTEYPRKYLKNAIGSIRIDVGCKCELKTENNTNYNDIIFGDDDDNDDLENRIDLDINENGEDEDTVYQKMENKNSKKKEDLVINLEMQKKFNKKNTQRFLRYIRHLDVKINSEKIWIVTLLINDSKNPRLNKSNQISYTQKMLRDYTNVIIYDTHVVLEIDLNFCYRQIKEGDDITLTNQKLGNEGKEWLKLLTMSIWCDKKDINKELFLFPNINEMNFYQEEVKNALIILSNVPDLC